VCNLPLIWAWLFAAVWIVAHVDSARHVQPNVSMMYPDVPFDDEESLTAGRRPCALVADDDDDVRSLVGNALSRDGYDVIEARDGSEALRLVSTAQRAPDIILTDIRMPDLSGLMLHAGLRDNGWMIPIVVISAYTTEQVRVVAEQFGADAVFAKPFDVDDLRTVVMSLLRPNNGPRAFAITVSDELAP
jgi:two-component system response regulator (stage 0 sporulation protein F)